VILEAQPGDPLATAAVQLASSATATSTARVYAHAWRTFVAFCEREGEVALPATRISVGRWLAERAAAGGGGSVRRDVAAIRDRHLAVGVPDPTGDMWVQRVAAGSLRLAAAQRETQAERQALPTSVVAHLVQHVPAWLGVGANRGGPGRAEEEQVVALRDAAMVALGLRLMRRGAELAALRVDDVEDRGDEGLMVTVRRSKTDQLATGLRLPVDATGGGSCPVGLLRRWLVVRHMLADRGDNRGALFVSVRGGSLSTSAISSIVRRSATAAGLEGRFSAHSMRIGGATAALGAGASIDAIRAIGGWSSDAVMRYLRPASAAMGGLSDAMGLR